MHTASNKSITSLSVRDNLVLTGGSDKNAVLFDLEQGSVTSTLKVMAHPAHLPAWVHALPPFVFA
jgi:hypothetical protein